MSIISFNKHWDRFYFSFNTHIAKSQMHYTKRVHDNSLTNISSLWHQFQGTKLTLAVGPLPAVLSQQWTPALRKSEIVEKNNLQKYNKRKALTSKSRTGKQVSFIQFSRLILLFSQFSRYFTINKENLRLSEKSKTNSVAENTHLQVSQWLNSISNP